jgi:hypothetical protein
MPSTKDFNFKDSPVAKNKTGIAKAKIRFNDHIFILIFL